jgi:hypothetical protein
MSVLSVGGVYVPFRSFRPSTLEVHTCCDRTTRQTIHHVLDALVHIAGSDKGPSLATRSTLFGGNSARRPNVFQNEAALPPCWVENSLIRLRTVKADQLECRNFRSGQAPIGGKRAATQMGVDFSLVLNRYAAQSPRPPSLPR